jgi:hypothetical protein
MWYNIALFAHVLGAIGLFVAVSLVVVAYVRMRRAATIEQVREWAATAEFAGKSIAFVSLLVIVPALYMVVVAWQWTTPWVLAALITVVALAVLGVTVSGWTIERVVAMARAAAPGRVPDELRAQLSAPRLWLMEATRMTLLVGIVFLMTVKPDAAGSLLALVGMLVLGLILGAISRRAPRLSSRKEKLV